MTPTQSATLPNAGDQFVYTRRGRTQLVKITSTLRTPHGVYINYESLDGSLQGGAYEESWQTLLRPPAAAVVESRARADEIAVLAGQHTYSDILAALNQLQANPNDPRAHRVALNIITASTGSTS